MIYCIVDSGLHHATIEQEFFSVPPLSFENHVPVLRDNRALIVASNRRVRADQLLVLKLNVIVMASQDELTSQLVVEGLSVKCLIVWITNCICLSRDSCPRTLALVPTADTARVNDLWY